MGLPKAVTDTAREFAEAVLCEDWSRLQRLFVASAARDLAQAMLAEEFGWEHLGPRLRHMFAEASGEAEETIPQLAPPRRYVIFEWAYREPSDVCTAGSVGVQFQPSPESGLEACYDCYLTTVEEDGIRIAAYAIELAA